MRIKSCVLLPAAGRRTQLFHLIFTEPGPRGLADPCIHANDIPSPFFAIDVPVRRVDRSKSRIAAARARPLVSSLRAQLLSRRYHAAGADVVWNKRSGALVHKDLHLLKVDSAQQNFNITTLQTTLLVYVMLLKTYYLISAAGVFKS